MCDSDPGIPGPPAAGAATDTSSPPSSAPFPAAAAGDSPASLLAIWVIQGESGPVVALSGDADMTTLDQLIGALDTQISTGARLVTVDMSQLRFADSATVATLVRAARTLRGRGARLELLHPQPAVARILALTGADQALTVRRKPAP